MMTKDEREYYVETVNKLNSDYMKIYNLFIRKIAWTVLDNRDLIDMKLEMLEMFYRNERIGNKVEEVIGKDKEVFLKDIINSYYENTSKLKIIKGILNNALSFCLIFFMLFLTNGHRSIVTVLTIPFSILLSIFFYLINRCIENNLIKNILNSCLLISVIFLYLGFNKLMIVYKDIYMIPEYIIWSFLLSIPIILFYLYKESTINVYF